MATKPIEDARSWSKKQPITSVLKRTSRPDRPISCVHQEETRRAACPIILVWQYDKVDASSYKTEASAQPVKRLRSILRTSLKKESAAQPITSIGRIIFGRTFFGRLFNCYITVTFFGESSRSDGLLVSDNQIIPTVI